MSLRVTFGPLILLFLTLLAPPTQGAGGGVRLNEVLAVPRLIDWDGDGSASSNDEWIELVNPTTTTVDIGGWQLDDIAGGGSAPYTFPAGTTIPAGDFLVVFKAQSGIALNNSGDDVRLIRDDGTLADVDSYGAQPADRSRARDAAGVWHDDQPPTPGGPNLPPATPTPPPATSSPTAPPSATAPPPPAELYLSEFVPRPGSDWDGDGTISTADEYIELHNRGASTAFLTGLQLDDAAGGTRPYVLTGTLAAGDFLVIHRSTSGIGLNDGGDDVRLLDAMGIELDAHTYGSAGVNQAWSRDAALLWHDDWTPSPGAPNVPPPATPTASPTSTLTPTASPTAVTPPSPSATSTTPPTATPTVTPTAPPLPSDLYLSEFVPRPGSDWNGDGTISTADEYIELHNRGASTAFLTGLQLDDAAGGTRPYVLTGTLAAGDFLVIHRSTSGIGLNDGGDDVRLLDAMGIELDAHTYGSAGVNQAWSRDAALLWHDDWSPSPGAPNVPPPATPTPTSTATATAAPSPTATASPTPTAPPTATVTASSTATPTATASPTATAPPSPTLTRTATATVTATASPTPTPTITPTAPPPSELYLSEFVPRPGSDWDGDGTISTSDEYIELHNRDTTTVSLDGLQLDDASGGSRPYVLTGTLAAGDFLVVYRSTSGIALNDSGDDIRLLDAMGIELDAHTYGSAGVDQAWSRDAGLLWHDDWTPSPGAPNVPPPATPTPTVTATASPTPTVSPSPTATATPTVGPSPTPGPSYLPVIISELVYQGDVSRQGDEFVELYNRGDTPVSLAGWRVGDEETPGGNEGMYVLPEGVVLAPGETLVIARDAAAFRSRFGTWPDFAFRGDAVEVPRLDRAIRWGRGHWSLTDDGDEALLVDPEGRIVDALTYRNGDFEGLGLTGHDISAPAPRALHALPEIDSSHLNDRLVYDLPTPGRPYTIPDAPPPPPGPTLDGLQVAWGSLHAHSTYSDGSGPPPLAFAVARENGMHFMGLSDHSHWYTESEWRRTHAAAREVNRTGGFVALVGFEWTHREQGHVNVFRTTDDASRERPDGATLEAFYTWLAARPGALAIFNHPFPQHFDRLALVPELVERLVGLEVGNGAGERAQRYEEAYFRALARGWRVGALGNLDTESADWGADGPLRTGLLVERLDETSIFAALEARRSFATEDANLALALRSDSAWMGESLEPLTRTLEILIVDPDGEPTRLELLRDGEPVATTQITSGVQPHRWRVERATRPGEIYVARAVQEDGDHAWTSPLWIEGEPREEEEEEEPGEEDVIPIAGMRALPLDSRGTVEGVVVAAPGTFAADVLYLQDDSGGIRLYARGGLDPVPIGTRLRVSGFTRRAFGELELSVPRDWPLERLGATAPPAPRDIPPGALAAHPGELVRATGIVAGWEGDHWRLDDGAQEIFVYHDRDSGTNRPFLTLAEPRRVTGIVGWSERGPRLMPRSDADLEDPALGAAAAPGLLPVTGAPAPRAAPPELTGLHGYP